MFNSNILNFTSLTCNHSLLISLVKSFKPQLSTFNDFYIHFVFLIIKILMKIVTNLMFILNIMKNLKLWTFYISWKKLRKVEKIFKNKNLTIIIQKYCCYRFQAIRKQADKNSMRNSFFLTICEKIDLSVDFKRELKVQEIKITVYCILFPFVKIAHGRKR